jgi:uncharacterized protein
MHFVREDCSDAGLIRSCEPGAITVGEQRYTRSLILCPGQAILTWRPPRVDALQEEDFEPVVALQPEILLLGTGSRLVFPAPGLTVRLMQTGIGVEVMDTPAACRTYNILLAEQRRVVAALLFD